MSIEKMLCTSGRFDIPIIQLQPPFVVDLLDTNIALFGAPMSGKTTFVKTLINILHKQYDEKSEQVFILDFGGALSEYRDFPLVSACFDNANEEYVKRIFKIMDNILSANIKALDGKNYRDADHQPPHTTFIIDNLNAFIDEPRYMAYQEKLAKLCRDGLSKGITIVVTAVETKGVLSYMGGFKQKIAFEMPQEKYQDIFNGKVDAIQNNPGHGFANVTVMPEGVTGTFRMNLPYEVQCTLPYKAAVTEAAGGNGDTEEDFLQKLHGKFGFSEGQYAKQVKKYQTFPGELTRDEYDKLCRDSGAEATETKERKIPVSVGLDYVDFDPVTVDLGDTHVVAIYGKKEFGKTNLLNLLLDGFAMQRPDARIVFLDDGRRQLEPVFNRLKDTLNCKLIGKTEEVNLSLTDGTTKMRKLSPMQQFYVELNERYIGLDKSAFLADIYGVNKMVTKECALIPDCDPAPQPFTAFVIQSKQVFLPALENKRFIEKVLPAMEAVAEEQGFLFIFSDVQKISDGETNLIFTNILSTAFLLDNIAEFAGERGQKTIFGNMDVKTLKEDYARCERGDGYFYDIEADLLTKLKFIKY